MPQVKKKKTQEDEERKARIQEGTAFVQAREKAASKAAEQQGISVKAGREQATRNIEAAGTSFRQVSLEQAQQATEAERQRQASFQEETGATTLGQDLSGKIQDPLDLQPEAFGTGIAEKALIPAAAAGNIWTRVAEVISGKDKGSFGRTTPEELAQTGAGRALGVATAAVATAAVAAFAAPYAVAAATKSIVAAKVAGTAGSIGKFKIARDVVVLGALGTGGATAGFDYKGPEMNTYRKSLQKMVEDGERIEAMTRNGYPTGDSISLLQQMSDEIDEAERRIKEISNKNIQYRVRKEYITDMAQIRSAREAVQRRVTAVENIAITGQAAFNPEALMYQAGQL